MTASLAYKRSYHPLVCMLYMHGMLTEAQMKQLPKTTKHNWNHYDHEDHFGHEWIQDFLADFDDIKSVFQRKHLMKTLKLICVMSNGYHEIMTEIGSQKRLLQKHASTIIGCIERTAEYAKVNVDSVCKYYGISRDWYYRQRNKLVCQKSILKRCFKQHPNQLTTDEVAVIEKAIKNPENYGRPKIYIYYDLLRKGLLFCGKSTFNKYANLLGYSKPKKIIKPRKKGFRATRVFEWLHIDITNIPTLEDGMQKVAFVKDNFSKALLHVKVADGKAGSDFIQSLLEEAFDKFGLFSAVRPINILSDGGSENRGKVLEWIDTITAPPIVTKITAQTDEFPWSNSMSESTHSKFKTEFMRGKISLTKQDMLISLTTFMDYANYNSFPYDLHGYCPMEVVNGDMPNIHRFKDDISRARKNRIEVNRAFNLCGVF